MTGISTDNFDSALLIDELIGNRDGSTVKITTERLVAQWRAMLGPSYAILTELVADLDWAAGSLSLVLDDPVPAQNGIYKKAGASGAGGWSRIGDLPTLIVRDRAQHTGTQAIATVTGLQTALDGKATAAQGAKADSALQAGASLAVLVEAADAKILTAAERSKLAGIAPAATANATDAALRDRASHTGAQAIATVTGLQTALDGKATAAQGAKADSALQAGASLAVLVEAADAKILTAAERAKLAGIAPAATANATDAALRDRASHTGTQAIATVTGLQTALDGKATAAQGAKADSAVQPAALALKADAAALVDETGRAQLAEALIGGGQRPGDLAAAYTADLTGTVAATVGYGDAAVVVDADLGAAIRLTTATHVAARAPVPVEPGRVYQARWVSRRQSDPSDPLGDAVEIGVRWLTESLTGVAGGSGNRVAATIPLTVAMGVQYRAATFAVDVAGTDYTIPAGARYARPWLRTYGADHQTLASRVELEDITEAWLAAQAVLAETAARAAAISTEATARNAAIASEAAARSAADAALDDAKANRSRTVSGAGLATGGGDLSANRTITVTAASPAEAITGTATDRAMTPDAARAALDMRLLRHDGGETVELLNDAGFVIARFSVNGDLFTRYLSATDDGSGDIRFVDAMDRLLMMVGAAGAGLPGMVMTEDGNEGFELMFESGCSILKATKDLISIAGRIEIKEDGVYIDGVRVSGEVAGGLGGALLGMDALRLVSDRAVTLWPRAISRRRGDSPAGIVAVASQPALPGAALAVASREAAILLPPDQLGETLEITLRDTGSEARLSVSMPVVVTPVPLPGLPAPKILALGDSITNRRMAWMIDALLREWGCAPQWIGTIQGSAHPTFTSPADGPPGEGRESWATGDFLNTDTDADVTAILAPGGEAAYLALPKVERSKINPFISGTTTLGAGGTFDPAFYLARFAQPNPDFVLLNLGMNNMLEQADPATAIAGLVADLTVMLAALRADLPAARILVWCTGLPRDAVADTRWDTVHAPMLAAIIALVRGLRAAGDTGLHLVPVWAVQSPETGWSLAPAAADPATGLASTTVADIVHPLGVNQHLAAELLAAAIASLI